MANDIAGIALRYVGYLEKETDNDLYDFTSNAGSNNYTMFGHWYGMNGQPWCDMFVSFCATLCGESVAVGKYAYCPSHMAFFQERGQYYNRGQITPKRNDIVFFGTDNSPEHIGIVYAVDANYVYTVEGNASTDKTYTPNGGGVVKKAYAKNSSYIIGYARPAYKGTTASEEVKKVVYKNGSTSEPVYSDSACTIKIGSLNPYESCTSFGKYDGVTTVLYELDNGNGYKIGFVKYPGS